MAIALTQMALQVGSTLSAVVSSCAAGYYANEAAEMLAENQIQPRYSEVFQQVLSDPADPLDEYLSNPQIMCVLSDYYAKEAEIVVTYLSSLSDHEYSHYLRDELSSEEKLSSEEVVKRMENTLSNLRE